MSKSSMAQVVAVSRQVNELDTRGKLVILRDLLAQGLERPKSVTIETGRIEKISATSAGAGSGMVVELVELLEAAGGKVVDVKCEEGKEK